MNYIHPIYIEINYKNIVLFNKLHLFFRTLFEIN